MTIRVAILISGGGSNMAALAASMTQDHPARPCLVLSNDPAADGVARASALGIPTVAIDSRRFRGDRAGFEASIQAALDAARPDVLCLAGFMRILSPAFVRRWRGRILNIHPSLLPKYPGLDTHARVLAAGDADHGCTVHLVTEVLDAGPVLGQSRLAVAPDDTPQSLAARVLKLEHALYTQVLRRFVSNPELRRNPGRDHPPTGGTSHAIPGRL